MIKLKCNSCGKSYEVSKINEFTACECGASLLPSTTELIDSIDNRIYELNYNIQKQSAEGLGGNFTVSF